MNEKEIMSIIEKQRQFFKGGKTKGMPFRAEQLKKLLKLINQNEKKIYEALKADLNKPESEAFFGEILMVKNEIDFALRNLSNWMKPEVVSTPLIHFPGKSAVHSEPYGVALIIGPWNYPFQLLFEPLVGAMAAGNCVILKPSEVSEKTSELISSIINESFDPGYISVITGGVDESRYLLSQKFDYIFYTGGTEIGKVVMSAASKFLTPVTLELGGKSPCIVDRTLHLESTARRIVWGKFFNAGQTCVAPDYLLINKSMKNKLINEMKKSIKNFYGENPQVSPDYARIINERHFMRLKRLLTGNIISGGDTDRENLYIAPTLIDDVSWDSLIMQEEIFGPLLPVFQYDDINDIIEKINERPKPLSLYLFTEDESLQDKIINETSSGGVCINDTIVHIGTNTLPFGGVGESGLGSYHGEATFNTFSHKKSVMKRSLFVDPGFRYPPYIKLPGIFKKIIEFIS